MITIMRLLVTTGTAEEKSRLRPCAENFVDISLLKQAKVKFSVTHEQRMQIEKNTRTQDTITRVVRCEGKNNWIKNWKILCQNTRTVALLTSVLYSKPLLHLPSAMDWGAKHESSVCTAYVKYMWSKDHKYVLAWCCSRCLC